MSSRRMQALAAIAAATFVPLAVEAARPAPQPPAYHYTELVPVQAGRQNDAQDVSRDGVVVGYTQIAQEFQLEAGGTCWPHAAAMWDMSLQPSQSSRPPDFIDDLGGCNTCASEMLGIAPDASFAVGWAGTPDDGLSACSTSVRRAAVWEQTGTTWVRTFLEPVRANILSEARAVAVVGGVPIATGRVSDVGAVVWRKLPGTWVRQALPALDPAAGTVTLWGLGINESGWVSGSVTTGVPGAAAAAWVCDTASCAGPYPMPGSSGGGNWQQQGRDVTENGDVLGNGGSPERPQVWRFAGLSGSVPTWEPAETLPELQAGGGATGWGIATPNGVLTVVGAATTYSSSGRGSIRAVRWQRVGDTWSPATPIEGLDDSARRVLHGWRIADTGRVACRVQVNLTQDSGGLERPNP